MAVAAKLKKLQKTWMKSEARTPGYTVIEDGDYVAKLKSMEVGESKGSNRLQVASAFEIVDGEAEGQTTMRFDGIEEESNMAFFKGYAEVLGIELPEDMEELPDALKAFVEECDTLWNITLRTKGEFQNLYVRGASDYELEEEEEEGEETEAEEAEEAAEEAEEEEEEEKPKPKLKKKAKVLEKKKKKR